jgi:hypothetical protein
MDSRTTDLEVVGRHLWCATSSGIVVLDTLGTLSAVPHSALPITPISIIPNPVHDRAVVTVALNDREELTGAVVVNVMGQTPGTRVEINGSSLDLDVAAIPAGVYFVQVHTSQGRRSISRLIVEK